MSTFDPDAMERLAEHGPFDEAPWAERPPTPEQVAVEPCPHLADSRLDAWHGHLNPDALVHRMYCVWHSATRQWLMVREQ